MPQHTTLRGRIRYTSNKPERRGEERGREHFTITRHGDGARSLRAHCEIDDPPAVLRDVVLSLDAELHPTDCFVRLVIAGRFEGSGWMRFGEHLAEAETFNARDGRVSQRLELDQRVRWLGAHPIAGDALAFGIYDRARGPGKQFFPNMMLTSPDHRGATGPLLYRLGFGLEYVGEEPVEVAAGRFDAFHFRYTDTAGQLPEEHPAYDVWCTADEDFVFLEGAVGGYMQTHYELVELERA